jgi:hypothetical protein
MGMFKDMRDLSRTGKQMKKERGGSLQMMKDGLAQANQALQQVQSDQALAEKLANEGVDATATINGMQATGKNVNMQPELQFDLTVDVNGTKSNVTHTQVVSPRDHRPAPAGRTGPGQGRSRRPLPAADRPRRLGPGGPPLAPRISQTGP